MAQLLSAVIAVFRESLVEGMKAFLKLNSAYKTLQRIIDAENAYLNKRRSDMARTAPSTPIRSEFRSQFSSVPGSPTRQFTRWEKANATEPPWKEDLEDEDEFYDAEEDIQTDYSNEFNSGSIFTETFQSPLNKEFDPIDPASPSDAFVHSGANFCMGLLLLMLALVPPALSKLLGIVGYKGDRKKGLRMLWSSSRYSNAIGALAALVLLAYYNGLMGATDLILPIDSKQPVWSEDNLDGYPAEQLGELLNTIQKRFPRSKIWPLEQARMLALQRALPASLEILKGDFTTPLKQLHALAIFERSLQAMYSHEYELCTSSFKECCKRNNWSHSLYMYCAAASQVELYRLAKLAGDTKHAEQHAAMATSLFHNAKDKTGRRKAFGKQLPFDTFVAHKVNKWESKAMAWGVSFIDAIGVSPLEEMIFLWNGFRKMSPDCLKISLERISWSESTSNPHWKGEELSEKALFTLLRAVVLRSLGQYGEAVTLLKDKLLYIDKTTLKGTNKEDWILPAAYYETGINLWMMCHRDQTTESKDTIPAYLTRSPTGIGEQGQANKKLMRESAQSLEKAATWEGYMLDARLGMRIEAALDVIRRWRVEWDK